MGKYGKDSKVKVKSKKLKNSPGFVILRALGVFVVTPL